MLLPSISSLFSCFILFSSSNPSALAPVSVCVWSVAAGSQQNTVRWKDEGNVRDGWCQKCALTQTQYKNPANISVLRSSNFVWRQNQLGRHTDAWRTLCVHLSSFAVSFSLLSCCFCLSLQKQRHWDSSPSLWLQPMTVCRDTRLPSPTTLLHSSSLFVPL